MLNIFSPKRNKVNFKTLSDFYQIHIGLDKKPLYKTIESLFQGLNLKLLRSDNYPSTIRPQFSRAHFFKDKNVNRHI